MSKTRYFPRPPKGASIAERLAHFSIPEPNSGCLLWIGGTIKGYGHLNRSGPTNLAHRLAWMAVHGPIPDGLDVCHKCDVRACINVNHLFLGTAADNAMDRARKLRGKRKLNPEAVLEIFQDKRPASQIAPEHDISVSAVWRIRSGLDYSWLTKATK